MCGGFGSLAQQGFLTPFPAREPRRGERETAQTCRKRPAQPDFSDTLRPPGFLAEEDGQQALADLPGREILLPGYPC